MAGFLANENVPGGVVRTLRDGGYDCAWVAEIMPGATDSDVLRQSIALDRVLITFDKDFGELVRASATLRAVGVILLRPRLKSPEALCEFTRHVLANPIDWRGNFCVAQEGRIRVSSLPTP